MRTIAELVQIIGRTGYPSDEEVEQAEIELRQADDIYGDLYAAYFHSNRADWNAWIEAGGNPMAGGPDANPVTDALYAAHQARLALLASRER